MEHGPLLEQLQAEVQPGQDEFDSPGTYGAWLVCE